MTGASESPIELSTRLIDEGINDVAPNRITHELSELGDNLALIEAFSHVVVLKTDSGLVAFDTSSAPSGKPVMAALRSWTAAPVNTIVYTHGHVDHVGGSRTFASDAEAAGNPKPRVVGHKKLSDRLDRYEATDGYNQAINRRQFGGVPQSLIAQMRNSDRPFIPKGTLRPDVTYETSLTETVGDVEMDHNYAMGETDDHTWTWIPSAKTITAGDLFIWNFPNCGNPQKVQRYPLEWAQALRAMAAKNPELLVPAHGLPIAGVERIAGCLNTVASTLEELVAEVVAAMNTGATLDDIVHSIKVADETLELPYMRPFYDEPEFAIRNIWRLYGGWWDGHPARLKPAPDSAIGAEVAQLAGGAGALATRAMELAEQSEFRLACHLIEFAAAAEPESAEVHSARSMIYAQRGKAETSLMAKGIFRGAKAESEYVVTGEMPEVKMKIGLLDPGDG